MKVGCCLCITTEGLPHASHFSTSLSPSLFTSQPCFRPPLTQALYSRQSPSSSVIPGSLAGAERDADWSTMPAVLCPSSFPSHILHRVLLQPLEIFGWIIVASFLVPGIRLKVIPKYTIELYYILHVLNELLFVFSCRSHPFDYIWSPSPSMKCPQPLHYKCEQSSMMDKIYYFTKETVFCVFCILRIWTKVPC